MIDKPKQVYVLYIRTSAARLWESLVSAALTPEWFGGMSVKFQPRVGAPLVYEKKGADGADLTLVQGEVLEYVPERRLAYSFSLQLNDALRADRESRVMYELEPAGDSIRLTVTHDEFEGETPSFHGVRQGWPVHLSSLKSWIETGKALQIPDGH